MFRFNNLKEIADYLGREFVGSPNLEISNINRIEDADSSDLTFFASPKYAKYLETTNAGAIIVPQDFQNNYKIDKALILSDNPHSDFVKLILEIDKDNKLVYPSIHQNANIHESAIVGENVFIGAFANIGENVVIGDNSVIMPGASIYKNVNIGNNTTINSNATIYHDCVIGNNCIIHAGAVIGADGFGFEEQADGTQLKIPQIGNVKIGDWVEIGANTTIDRAIVGSTIIQNGVKIDNLVQIGHNALVKNDTLIVSQAGISGSTKIGARNKIGGQVGMVGHIELADDVAIGAQSGVAKSIRDKGVYFGSPAIEIVKSMKISAAMKDLPDLVREFNALKKKINTLNLKENL